MRDDISFSDLFVPLTKKKICCFLFILGFLIYFNSFFNGFIGDDHPQILDNTPIHSISNIPSFFSGSTFAGTNQKIGVYYKPLLTTTFSGLYTFFGPQAFFFHLVQVTLFITNACLVFLVFTHFFKKEVAFVLAAIFLVHPINAEVALYISAMQDVLFFFFGISALLLLIHASSKKLLIPIVVLLCCSLLSKETGIVFLAVALLYTLFFKRSYLMTLFFSSLASFVLYLFLRFHAIGMLDAPLSSPIDRLPLLQRTMNIPEMVSYYLFTTVFPLHLSFSHQWAYTTPTFQHFYFPLLIMLLFLIALCSLFFVVRKTKDTKHKKYFLFFSGVFFLGMSLHLQLFPLDVTVAERWFYVPLFGLLGIIGTVVSGIKTKKTNILLLLACVLITLFTARTFIRTFDWRDDLTLTLHDSMAFPNDYNLQNGVAYALMQKGEFKKALPYAKRSVELYPFWNNYNTLGVAYANVGDYEKARYAYEKGMAIMPHYLLFENNAALTMVTGTPQKNKETLEKMVRQFPNSGKMWMYLSIAQYKAGDKETAFKSIETALLYYQSSEVVSIYTAIKENKPLILSH